MKSWVSDIENHIQKWSSKLGTLDWWPKYVYHFTDVNNAASIIKSGHLYSRMDCAKHSLMQVDNASPEIIRQTSGDHQEFVRLYFRPKTPTQYINEGIRPKYARQLNAHCPIPIFFCFDAVEILAQDDSMFSNGNMGSNSVEYGNDLEFFNSIPFKSVFHNGVFSPEERANIVFHRHAEVLVPHILPLLPTLRFVACRSAAERQTLLQLLPSNLRLDWSQQIRIPPQGIFEKKWLFVQDVVVVDEYIQFTFNPNATIRGPFQVRVSYATSDSEGTREIAVDNFTFKKSVRIRVQNPISGIVRLYLDDALAFAGRVIFDDGPF